MIPRRLSRLFPVGTGGSSGRVGIVVPKAMPANLFRRPCPAGAPSHRAPVCVHCGPAVRRHLGWYLGLEDGGRRQVDVGAWLANDQLHSAALRLRRAERRVTRLQKAGA